jgi:hypothetical protein
LFAMTNSCSKTSSQVSNDGAAEVLTHAGI